MNFALLVIFMLVAFGLTTLFRKWIDIPTLLAVAIGCACCANLYTPLTYPIPFGPFVFSIEIVLYTLYMYTIMIRILDYGYTSAKTMTFTSVAAIVISAFIELVAFLTRDGFTGEVFKNFSYYLFSAIGSIIGVWIMVLITIHLRKKNVSSYIIIPLGLIAASLIHAFFYYGWIALINLRIDLYTRYAIFGTMMGKTVCIALAVLCYFINQKYWVPNKLLKLREENKGQ